MRTHSESSLIFSKIIDAIALINDRIFEVSTETKVSSVTCFSSSFLLSIFPTRTAANPNSTVKTKAYTVVKTLATLLDISYPNIKTSSIANTIGATIKQTKSHTDIFSFLAFLKTESCFMRIFIILTLGFKNSIHIKITITDILAIFSSILNHL